MCQGQQASSSKRNKRGHHHQCMQYNTSKEENAYSQRINQQRGSKHLRDTGCNGIVVK